MSITRRFFLRNTAAVGAVGATVGAPAVVSAEPQRTPLEQATWHMRELERLAFEDGALDAHITIVSKYGENDVRLFGIHYKGFVLNRDGMFAGGGRNG